MNANRLLKHYERIADAPDAIARLRRFILDLAVRGKLVPQDPKDEPPAELLKRIAAEKVRLVKAGQIRKLEADPLASEEMPFDLPRNWAWTRIGEICSKTGSGSTPRGGQSSYQAEGVPFLRSQNVYDDGLRLDDVAYIDQETHSRMAGTVVKPNDLLLNITGGSIGRCCLVPGDFSDANISQHVAIIRVVVVGMQAFIHKLILSPYFQAFIFSEQTGAGRGGLPKNRMDRIPVALPPLTEQHRIVAKVDELMALCDRLEAARAQREAARDRLAAARAQREAARDRLAAASLARLNTPDPASFQDDARFALDTLPALTTRPDQIKQLRQTILNLAVRGKLVPQDPKDEPASELLKRIAAEKVRLVKAGIIPRQMQPSRDTSYLAHELPNQWEAIALGEVCNLVTSGSRGWGEFYADAGPRFIRAQNIRFGKLQFDDLACVNPPNNSEGSRTRVARGDLFVVITGAGVTNPAMLDRDVGEAYVSQHIGLVKPTDGLLSRWLLLCLMSPAGGRGELVERAYGAGRPGLNLDNIRSLSIPLPPLAEQHRIVAKVDELMALCDRLEASLAAAAATRRRLLDALLAEALAPAEPQVLDMAG
jgi:type I restriction enzyme S subunit